MRPRPPGVVAAVAAVCLLSACGSGSSNDPTPLSSPSPSPTGAASRSMTLAAQMGFAALTGSAGAASGAGNWGYTAPGGRRFALTGTSLGTSIVEVTDPARPRSVGFIQGPSSSWREIRTFGDVVYVTTEAVHGLDIISMRDPDRPVRVQTWNRTFNQAHSLWIDVDRGLLFANGTRMNGVQTGTRILDLTRNPEDPREVGSFTPFYIHDSYTRGNVLFASAINDGFEALIDVSDPANPRETSRFFTGGRFTHNSWLTRDGRYLFTTDERIGRPLEGWDMINPAAPRKVSEFIANPGSIPHNVMVDGDRLLVSHYTEGVYLLDVRDPERPQVLGFYDTYTGAGTGFNGCWGAYVFPGTNLIVASDINSGLFVIQYTP
jgi:choice-of-anchor B domain-containing protein